MDTFLLGSLSFIFMSLVEFVLVLNIPSYTDDNMATAVSNGDVASTNDDQDMKVILALLFLLLQILWRNAS